MISLQALQNIASNPPTTVLGLYSLLCDAHTYCFGDFSRIGAPRPTTMATSDDTVFTQITKDTSDDEAVIATCLVGATNDTVTTYTERLAVYCRYSSTAKSFADALGTSMLGKTLGQHLADAMGYPDYVVVRGDAMEITDVTGNTQNVVVMPLVLPPGIVMETGDYAKFIDASSSTNGNKALLAGTTFASAAGRLTDTITIHGKNIRPAAWFYCYTGYAEIIMPINTYLTDDQCWATINDRINVMQHQLLNDIVGDVEDIKDAAEETDGSVENLQAGYASIVAMVGSLSVFGNSVKEVTEHYNTANQYIPRP